MDATQKGILTLIKAAVLQKPFPLPEDFSIEEAYNLIVKQHITALAFEGALLCGISRQESAMVKLFQGYCRSLQISEGQLQELKRVFQAFEENGIDYLPMKGCVMKGYYPKPELRTMGDADVLIRPEQNDRIAPVMKKLGFVNEGLRFHHTEWTTGLLHIELHHQLVPEENSVFLTYWKDAWRYAIHQSGYRYAMSTEDTFLFLVVHFAKHYMGSGIGCRQAVDLWVYLRAHPELDRAVLREKMDAMHLWAFFENIEALLRYWFEDAPANEKLEHITQYIFSAGSWGTTNNLYQTEAIRDLGHKTSESGMKYIFFVKRILPGAKKLKGDYPILIKAPWLLPVVWVIRIVDKLFITRDFAKKRKIFSSEVTTEKVEQRKRDLAYVGLDKCVL